MEGFSYFLHLFHSGGIVMYPLLFLSLITVAIAVERFSYYKKNRRQSKKFFTGVRHAAAHQQWDMAGEICQSFPTAISRVVEQGLRNDQNEKAMRHAFMERMAAEAVGFRRYLDYLSAIVTIAPLLGLLGTVTGMINTFSILDNGAGAAAITGGVGEALVATASGLCVAILAFCVYTYFSHQLDVIVTDTEGLCADVLNAKKESWGRA
ncbi:MotA/TolQ/ExbB proton channel family protein [uncultured Megasphaera sp.]|jgi:biopolymer transport protein ExbB|uniref:MotA/TolQ/ExbB proton channel family protein n=1 Tax=uncultured Megasphaera sp. TaxID=165188 RepID=UPI002600D34C|nr:MotA/TolQ/ExbB proton channel family protein [uncultured Megasphaera sp.]